nr:PTS sugar transporter subunit IIA [Olsenella sp. SW781]
MLFDELDSRDIRDFLEGEQRSGSFACYFSEELFLPHLPQTTREEVLRFMCERIQSVIEEPEDYEQLVWERESVAPSAFGGRVAMPHPIRPVGEKTIVCVGVLDQDVTWGEHQVRVVFLVTISATNRKEVQGFYEDMVKLITDKGALERLMAEQSWDAMSQIIASIERN